MDKPQVLLVDDDRPLLDSLFRELSHDYDCLVAASGSQALDLIATVESLPVAVTDLQMPGMDGVQFIVRARQLLPDTSYLMLTGDQRIDSIQRAVNEGEIFRLLSKPCDLAELRTAIETGHRRYNRILADQSLLTRTSAGAVTLLRDVLDFHQPDTQLRLTSFRETFEQLRSKIGLRLDWELALASRLALIGLVGFSPEESRAFLATPPNKSAWRGAFQRVLQKSLQLCSRVPRIEIACPLLEAMPAEDGSYYNPDAEQPGERLRMGATLLHIAALLDAALSQGLARRQAIAEVRLALQNPRPEYLEVLDRMAEPELPTPGIEVDPSELRDGMVLYADFKAADGYVLFRAGKRVTGVVIERIRERFASGEPLRPVQVVNTDAAIGEPV